uniref:Uncharacterized protein n=1 Tax=Sinocyclocheilus rhinocerous TaxID=307959 RepID=A0A673FTB7_9TELE
IHWILLLLNLRVKKLNLNPEERTALKSLQSDSTITIKQADKGGAIVIMDTEKYQAECTRQLLGDVFYTCLPSDPTVTYNRQIKYILEDAVNNNVIDKSTFAFLYVQHPRVPLFYTLPKIHKSLENPVGRPIVSGIGSVTEKISQYVDYYLKPQHFHPF